ncbi:hypothetical protein ASC94_10400 [Massilia sp. Root418]|uniref:circadian clock KaiB family protein n=1 Tax=Massilia sp. Root418 TaxID=1736532 RepID=UPI0006F9B193|nr:circadian clock KaiB family protein [Massilia sp. Root418]KQW97189.1 hypothetical protein ASC94_10400 [Massilia sp. Root418]
MDCSAIYKFRLYVAGDAPNSMQALENLQTLCDAHLAQHYEIEVVDVFREQMRALEDGVFMTPTLLKLEPPAVRRIVGSLKQTEDVLLALGLPPR